MAGSAHQGERPGGDRRKDGDVFRVPAQDLFGELHHDVETAGALQDGCAPDHREDGQHHVDGWFARGQPEDEDEYDQAHSGDEAQANTPVMDSQQQTGQNNEDLEREGHGDQFLVGELFDCQG